MQPSLQACLLHARSNARDAGRRRGGREGGEGTLHSLGD